VPTRSADDEVNNSALVAVVLGVFALIAVFLLLALL
jgi:hypothetical protein